MKEKEIDKISVEQINEAFEKCGNLKEVVFYFGKKIQWRKSTICICFNGKSWNKVF